MILDMREFGRLAESGVVPVQISEPFMDVRVVGADVSDVRLFKSGVSQDREGGGGNRKGTNLEVLHINNIKPYNRSIQPNIRLRDLLAKIKRPLRLTQMLLHPIQTREERSDRFIIRFLRSSKARFVDPVVDVVVGPVIGFVDFLLQIGGEQIYIPVFLWKKIIELYITD
jgi:hypothetical protein